MKQILKRFGFLGWIGVFLLGVFAQRWMDGGISEERRGPAVEASAVSLYTCSMHPQIQLPDADAPCPICGMDLIAVADAGSAMDSGASYRMSPRAQRLAEVEMAPVVRQFPTHELRLVGKVAIDETRLSSIAARAPGRIERLFVDYTGVAVSQGDHLIELYSPELVTAQREALQAVALEDQLSSSVNSFLSASSRASVASSRTKLRQLGFTPAQVDQLMASGTPFENVTLYSPISGVVVRKAAIEGQYVTTGTELYAVADLSSVWALLEAYESDLPWLAYGHEVVFETAALPGERFYGRIAFIDPTLDSTKRTVTVRVNVANPEGRLKPEMYVNATVRSVVGREGPLADVDLTGKWISPMHPEIVKDGPGFCDVCGMALEPAIALGLGGTSAEDSMAPLVIPATAPLVTGERAVVYIESAPGEFEGREIVLGVRAGEVYTVRSGLLEGERVVSRGAFKIDSAIQIQTGRGMMTAKAPATAPHRHGGPETVDAPPTPWPAPGHFLDGLDLALDGYFTIADALSRDGFEGGSAEAQRMVEALDAVDDSGLDPAIGQAWRGYRSRLREAIETVGRAQDVPAARVAFEPLSQLWVGVIQAFGGAFERPIYVYHCPMAFGGRGADWLQPREGTENPYYGASMFRCGTLERAWAGRSPLESPDE